MASSIFYFQDTKKYCYKITYNFIISYLILSSTIFVFLIKKNMKSKISITEYPLVCILKIVFIASLYFLFIYQCIDLKNP